MVALFRIFREALHYRSVIFETIFPSKGLRFINWYMQHGCDLDCYYCKVPKQRVGLMDREDRRDARKKVRKLCSKQPVISILGGEPTLRPDFLIEAIEDATRIGFLVYVVSNGWGLTPDLIGRLASAGLQCLSISVDCDEDAVKSNLDKALFLQSHSRKHGIQPVINTVLTRKTNLRIFKQFVTRIINASCFVNPLMCSPEVIGGVFSSASEDSVPTADQIRKIIPWLAWKKLTTGLISPNLSYFWTLYRLTLPNNKANLWHCSPNFRSKLRGKGNGRGFMTLDSDGFAGPCQEFPRVIDLLNISFESLSLNSFEDLFSETTRRCPGCLHKCYMMEESLGGPKLIAETSTFVEIAKVKTSVKA